MLHRIASSDFSNAYRLAENLTDDQDKAVIYFDWNILTNRLEHLQSTFHQNTIHAIAIKTCPLVNVLKKVVELGFGLEAASFEEIQLALHAGIDTSKLVFDSPVKTQWEIDQFIQHCKGAYLNINTLEELECIPKDANINLGIRINPLVSADTDAIFNVSTDDSKFGVPISFENQILDYCIEYPNVNGIHIHVGSNLSSLHTNIQAIEKVVALIDKIEAKRAENGIDQKITYFDLGGGFPANYAHGEQAGLADYVQDIITAVPNLFDRFKTITEYGRFVYAHTAWVLSEVESIKHSSSIKHLNKDTALIHVGGDMMLREIYQSNPIQHNLSILDHQGNLKEGSIQKVNIAGPLCYGGDYIGKDLELPSIELNDKVIIEDIGANTFALWSRHCSRSFPKVIAYDIKENKAEVIKRRESIEDIINFWS